MILVFTIVALLLAVPVCLEVYTKGGDNILSRAGAEIVASRRIKEFYRRSVKPRTDFTNAAIVTGLIVAGVALIEVVGSLRLLALTGLFSIMSAFR